MNKEENDMGRILFIGFKGTKNSSGLLVRSLSPRHCLLTNSFEGLRKDIEKLPVDCDRVYLFGADKNLRDSFRLERMAEKDGIRLTSALDPEKLADQFASSGILTGISETPTRYLCNEAYWYLLGKYSGNALLIHIPTMKHLSESWISGTDRVFQNI